MLGLLFLLMKIYLYSYNVLNNMSLNTDTIVARRNFIIFKTNNNGSYFTDFTQVSINVGILF